MATYRPVSPHPGFHHRPWSRGSARLRFVGSGLFSKRPPLFLPHSWSRHAVRNLGFGSCLWLEVTYHSSQRPEPSTPHTGTQGATSSVWCRGVGYVVAQGIWFRQRFQKPPGMFATRGGLTATLVGRISPQRRLGIALRTVYVPTCSPALPTAHRGNTIRKKESGCCFHGSWGWTRAVLLPISDENLSARSLPALRLQAVRLEGARLVSTSFFLIRGSFF